MADNLGLSLGLQAQPERYENIYTSTLKQKGAEQAAQAKAEREDSEAFKKYTSDIKVDPNLYHKSQERGIRELYSNYLSDIEKLRKDYPHNWQNYMPQKRIDLQINMDKMKLQGDNIKKLYAIPINQRTAPQQEAIRRLDAGEDVTGMTDPLDSFDAVDGYVTPKYTLDPRFADVSGSIAKEVVRHKNEQLSSPQVQHMGEADFYKFSKTQLQPQDIEVITENIIAGNEPLLHQAQEAKRKELEALHNQAVKEEWTDQELTEKGRKIIHDYIYDLADSYNQKTYQGAIRNTPKKSSGGLTFKFGLGGGSAANKDYVIDFGEFDTEYELSKDEIQAKMKGQELTPDSFLKSDLYKELSTPGTTVTPITDNGEITGVTIKKTTKAPTLVIKGSDGLANAKVRDLTDEKGKLIRITPSQLEKDPSGQWFVLGKEAGTGKTKRIPYYDENIKILGIDADGLWEEHLREAGRATTASRAVPKKTANTYANQQKVKDNKGNIVTIGVSNGKWYNTETGKEIK